jgi:CRP-like cAMP-binding protein
MANFAGGSTLNFGGATPSGNFVPEIFSQKALNIFRRRSTAEAITNTDYFGEIAAFGDTVRIIKEPSITVTAHLRNDTVTPQALTDDQILLVLDQANRFAFKVDDIEEAISHINWMSLATDRAAYELKQAFDNEVLDFMSDGALAANQVGDGTVANLTDLTTPDALLDQMANMATRLSLQDVPDENRWIVMPVEAAEILMKAGSKLINMDFNGGFATLQNGLVSSGKIRGFNVYVTNNAPTRLLTGTPDETHHVLMAGHMSACSTASAITQSETFRDPNTFADIVRGLHVYGRSIIRPESLTTVEATFTGATLV